MSNATVNGILVIFLLASAAGAQAQLVVNEVDYDQAGTDTAEFIEIRNNGAAPVDLAGHEIRLVNGAGGGAAIYQTIVLPSFILASGGYYVVCGNAAIVLPCHLDVTPDTDLIQNGDPDAVALAIVGGGVVDTVSYGGNTGAPYTEGSGATTDDILVANRGISRFPNGIDTNLNDLDFSRRCVSPNAVNVPTTVSCPPPTPVELLTFSVE